MEHCLNLQESSAVRSWRREEGSIAIHLETSKNLIAVSGPAPSLLCTCFLKGAQMNRARRWTDISTILKIDQSLLYPSIKKNICAAFFEQVKRKIGLKMSHSFILFHHSLYHYIWHKQYIIEYDNIWWLWRRWRIALLWCVLFIFLMKISLSGLYPRQLININIMSELHAVEFQVSHYHITRANCFTAFKQISLNPKTSVPPRGMQTWWQVCQRRDFLIV